MADYYMERGECREGVDDEPTVVAGVVINCIRVRPLLNCTVDADRV